MNNLRQFPFEAKITIAAKEMTAHLPFIDSSAIGTKSSCVHPANNSFCRRNSRDGGIVLMNLAIVPFITYFILAEGDLGIKSFVEKIPNKYFEMSLNLIDKIGKELISYLRGLLLECCTVGLLSIIGFMIIGVPYAVIIGVFTGIANLVPYLGPVAGACVALLASLTVADNFQMFLPIVVLLVVVRLIDDLLLQPLCFGKTLDMHPVAVVLVLIIGHQLMGVTGMIISIPIATILRVSATETYWGLKHYTITA